MKAYRLVVHNSRGAAPIELVAEMAHDARITEFCRQRLMTSPHLASIEVWSGAVKLFHFRSEARQAA
jgi:hypothetical protein